MATDMPEVFTPSGVEKTLTSLSSALILNQYSF
jgi:hypothetical protein